MDVTEFISNHRPVWGDKSTQSCKLTTNGVQKQSKYWRGTK